MPAVDMRRADEIHFSGAPPPMTHLITGGFLRARNVFSEGTSSCDSGCDACNTVIRIGDTGCASSVQRAVGPMHSPAAFVASGRSLCGSRVGADFAAAWGLVGLLPPTCQICPIGVRRQREISLRIGLLLLTYRSRSQESQLYVCLLFFLDDGSPSIGHTAWRSGCLVIPRDIGVP